MKTKINDYIDKLLGLLLLKKFMIFHAIVLVCSGLLSIIYSLKSLILGNYLKAIGLLCGWGAFYLMILGLQSVCVSKGAENRYLYFFLGNKEK